MAYPVSGQALWRGRASLLSHAGDALWLDGNYTNQAMTRVNSDLANDLGNLLSRTVAMIEKYFDGVIQAPGKYEQVDLDLIALLEALPQKVEEMTPSSSPRRSAKSESLAHPTAIST